MGIRPTPTMILSIGELKWPQGRKEIIMAPRGLVLIVGSTGSGKSTTLASMIDFRNTSTSGHILTTEDQIEYLHRHQKSIDNHRAVGLDPQALHNALQNTMRQAQNATPSRQPTVRETTCQKL